MCCIYTMECYSAIKQKETDGPREYHTKWSKSEKEKYDVTNRWNLKKKMIQMKLQSRNRPVDIEIHGYERGK